MSNNVLANNESANNVLANNALANNALVNHVMTNHILLIHFENKEMIEERIFKKRTEFLKHLQQASLEHPVYGTILNIHENCWIRTNDPLLISEYTFITFLESHKEDGRVYGNLTCVPNRSPYKEVSDKDLEVLQLDMLTPPRDAMSELFKESQQKASA
jgi:3-phenylpropionate/cinnamic acid dioxygenase small subunit